MSKKIRLNLDLDTGTSERQVESLKKKIQDLSKGTNIKISQEYIDNVSGKDGGNSNSPEMSKVLDALDKSSKSYEKMISEFTRFLKNTSNEDKDTQGSPTKNSDPTKSTPKTKDSKEPKAPDEKKLSDYIGKAIGAIFTGKAVVNYISQGMGLSKEAERDSMRIYNRTGQYGSDFNQGRVDGHKTGSKYGYSYFDVMNTEDKLIEASGFNGKENLQADSSATLEMSRAYGMESGPLIELFGSLSKSGAYKSGQSDEVINVVASSIKSGGMVGRENEQVRAIQSMQDALTTTKLNVTSEDFKGMVGLHDTLGNINESLKGERGAQTINKANQGLDANDQQMLRMAGYGGELGYGSGALVKAKRRLENGIQDPETMNSIMKNMESFGVTGDMATLYLSDKMGMTIDETEAMHQAMKIGGNLDLSLGQKDLEEKTGNILNSDALKRLQYDANRENAKTSVGNFGNNVVTPFQNIYNDMTPGGQAATDIIGMGVGGYGLSKVGNFVTKGVTGGKGFGNLLNGLGKSNEGMDFLIKGVGNSADDVLGAGSKIASAGGKITSGAGKVLPFLPAAIGGVKAIDKFSKGENKEASEDLGEGLGGTSGALAGAAIGSFLGPIGTAVGGLIGGIGGSFLGKKAGGGIHDAITDDEDNMESETNDDSSAVIKRSDSLLDKQEMLLKKEELLFDKFLGEGSSESSKELDMFNAKLLKKDDFNLSKPSEGASEYLDRMNSELSGGATSDSNGSGVNITGGNASERIWNALLSDGYSKTAAAAVLGNLEQESGINPKAVNSKSGAYGLAQWLGGRKTKLFEFAKSEGKDSTDLDTQIKFMIKELAEGKQWINNSGMTFKEFKTTNNIQRATTAFAQNYERMGAHEANMPRRNSAANKYFDQYKNSSPKSSYAVGTPYVTEDKQAFLHKEEAVLNKFEAKDYREGRLGNSISQSSKIDLNININSDGKVDKDIEETIRIAIAQAIAKLNLRKGIDLSKTYERSPY